MRRGDLVVVALPGDYGKSRPALVIQSDLFAALPSVTLLPITSELRDAQSVRIRITPTETNNLHDVSQIMVDKIHTMHREKVGEVFGRLEEITLADVDRTLALFLGLA